MNVIKDYGSDSCEMATMHRAVSNCGEQRKSALRALLLEGCALEASASTGRCRDAAALLRTTWPDREREPGR